MPAVKSTILAMLAASAAVSMALPSPQAATDDISGLAPLHMEVQCGCWNLCTLEALGDTSITGCDSACDPQFLCETIDALSGGPTTIAAAATTPLPAASASATALARRERPHNGAPPPFNPFGPGGELETLSESQRAKAKAKREVVQRMNRPIIDPCPQGVVCEAFAKREPEPLPLPLPPIDPFGCPHGPLHCPPPVGDAWKRAAAAAAARDVGEFEFEKRRINWDLTVKGSCNGGGCGGEVSVTIHF
ncbi:hypothetical protein Z517_00443 [Fonsecaea pedrosoi CBS 271.37]|uniref:Extracellular membrane protein CFEM domain-containing protein n=1 Tax=Fonsecaea pedrosoi CBS 271.37 TaxID=1442368 RepID=A0A0D2H2K0_9EURO|nr:uncharacterized protein Z517_00443 [Fonsecaea pedrosoi CBS 271.37]KIW85055.1 hypothetical protein Z517_00443 [Fonsecaea pedrosoi CBS 271.37]